MDNIEGLDGVLVFNHWVVTFQLGDSDPFAQRSGHRLTTADVNLARTLTDHLNVDHRPRQTSKHQTGTTNGIPHVTSDKREDGHVL